MYENQQMIMQSQINDLEALITDLKDKAEKADIEVKAKLEQEINNLEAKKQALKNHLSELKEKSEDKLNKIMNDMSNMSERIK